MDLLPDTAGYPQFLPQQFTVLPEVGGQGLGRVLRRTAMHWGQPHCTGCQLSWRYVPAEAVGCSWVTAWRRLRHWTEAGVWPRLHAALLAELRRASLLDLDDCSMDGPRVRALNGGTTSDPRLSIGPALARSTT